MTVREYLDNGGSLGYKDYLYSKNGESTFIKYLDVNKYLDCEMHFEEFEDDDGCDENGRRIIRRWDDIFIDDINVQIIDLYLCGQFHLTQISKMTNSSINKVRRVIKEYEDKKCLSNRPIQ